MALIENTPKKPRVVLIHGIYVREGASHIRQLQPHFEAAGFEVVVFEYGFVTALLTYFLNPGIARRLAELVRPDDHLVCHSNGAAIAWLAMKKHGMRCLKASLIAPALDDDKIMAGGRTDVYHNRCDHVVVFARLFIGHAWGSMGRDGCTTAEGWRMGMHNIDVADHAGLPQICGHLEYFEPHILPRLGPWLVRRHLERD
jgi:hypothetical protein